MASFLENAKAELERILKEEAPLQMRLSGLAQEKAYHTKVLVDGATLYPDVAKRLKLDTFLAQLAPMEVSSKEAAPRRQRRVSSISSAAPQVAMTGGRIRRSSNDISAAIAGVFKKHKNNPLHARDIAVSLANSGFYESVEKAMYRVESVLAKDEGYERVAPRTFQPRKEQAPNPLDMLASMTQQAATDEDQPVGGNSTHVPPGKFIED